MQRSINDHIISLLMKSHVGRKKTFVALNASLGLTLVESLKGISTEAAKSQNKTMNPVAVHRVSFECVSRFSLIHRESVQGFSGRRIVNSRGRKWPTRRLHAVTASLITSADSFEVGRLIGSYGFMNVTRYSHCIIFVLSLFSWSFCVASASSR